MEDKRSFLFKSDEYIEQIDRGGTAARLLARGDQSEVIKTFLPKDTSFYLDSAEEWQGFEFFYILEGTLSYLGSEAQAVLGPGDYIARHNIPERSWFKAESDVILLCMSSQPAFHVMKQEAKEFYELAREIETDEYMDGHCKRLEKLAILTGKRLGLTGEQLWNLSYAAFFHDLGKAKIPKQILQKPAGLTDDEWDLMKQHTVWGREMLEEKDHLREAARIVEQTHERVDGKGYPRGLKGDEIAEEAKVIAVVDAYDAMTSNRPYRKALSHEEAIRRLRKDADHQFDRRVVEAFFEVLEGHDPSKMYRNIWYDEELARLKQREAFLQIGEEVLAGKDLQQILDNIAQAITGNTPFRRAAIALYERPVDPQSVDQVETVQVACAGLTPEEEQQLRAHPLPPKERKKIFRKEFKLSRSYYIPHHSIPWRDQPGMIRSRHEPKPGDSWHPDDLLFIPLYVGDRLIGNISVDDPIDGKAPTGETLEPIEMFANLAALAMEKAQHIQQLDDFQKRLEGIYDLGKRFTQVEDEESLLQKAIHIISKNFPHDYIAVILVEEDRLRLKAQHGKVVCPYRVGDAISIGEGIIGWVAQYGEPALVEDVTQDPRYIRGEQPMGSELAVPIRLGDEVIGVLNLESQAKGSFDPDDVRLLGALADQIALALGNLRRQKRLQDLAIHDPLTGVYNRHHFSELIEKEEARARRYRFPVSLVMIDFDDFHEVNDRSGHLEGDRVLKEAAAVFQANVREVDTVIRYGGDEFLIVMPETAHETAEKAGQRLRRRLAREDFGVPGRISISIGISTWEPDGGKSFNEVLEEADRWMYRRYKRKKSAGASKLQNTPARD